MKKVILTLIVASTLLSCKKEGNVCWNCKSAVDGHFEVKCDDGQGQFRDAGGDMTCFKIH